MNEIEKAYIAGLFDGEGCIQLHRNNYKGKRPTAWQAMCVISQKNAKFLKEIRDLIGYGTSSKTTYAVGFRMAAQLISDLQPYLRLKQNQAGLFLEACLLLRHKSRRFPSSTIEKRLEEIAMMIEKLHLNKGRK